MKRLARLLLTLPMAAGCVLVSADETGLPPQGRAQDEIARAYASPTAMFASSVTIPPGHETIRLSGMIADPVFAGVYGDTEQQSLSVLWKIGARLAELGASQADVVAATVYLVAPAGQSAMDFAGLNRAWARHFGSARQPNRPVRSTVQVAGLAAPGLLVEIEVTAARRQE